MPKTEPTERVTRVTLFVPGPAALAKTKIAGEVETEWVENDGEFGAAFSYGTCEKALVKQIDKAPGALVLRWAVDLKQRKEIVAGVKKLADAGALAVRLEQSKLGWAIDQWMTVFLKDDVVAWHRVAVVFLGGAGYLQSCGMHAFSLPDVRIGVEGNNGPEMQRLATVLNLYQIDDDPMIRSGQTFAPEASMPKRLVERWPDTGYPPGHACHNPYGVWHIGPPGGKARSLGELQPTHMPPLLALLTAAEGKGKKLTQKQVEKIRDDGVCIAMKPRDVQLLERQRGFADLDAELVWEQWKAFRDLLKS